MEKFKSIPELIQSLNQLALRINKGSVGLEEFETTLRDARELYERLVILRYKAIEDRNLMGMSTSEQKAEDKVEEAPESTEELPLAAKQISLIDSIEEIAREAPPVSEPKKPEPKDPKPAESVAPKTSPKPENVEERANENAAPRKKEEESKSRKSDVIPPANVQAKKMEEMPDTLADKLGQSRIDDLTVAIGLNQKFQFINELFDGDADTYRKAVQTLNQCDSQEEALQLVKNEWMNPYNWDEEDKVTLTFLNLVERRYQS